MKSTLNLRKQSRSRWVSATGLWLALNGWLLKNAAWANPFTDDGNWWHPIHPIHPPHPRPVPEFNSAWILLPLVLAVALFSSRRWFRRQATGK